MAAMIDQRAFPRVQLELRTGYAQLRTGAKLFRDAFTRDVSRSGFLVETPSYEPFAGEFRGRFRLPGQEAPVAFEARTVWSRAGGRLRKSGCVFTRLDAADRVRLEALLDGVWTQMLTVY